MDTNELTEVNSQTQKTKTWGINQESGINIHTPLCIKQVDIKDQLYSTRNYLQYLVITYFYGENMLIYIYESFCCTHEYNILYFSFLHGQKINEKKN